MSATQSTVLFDTFRAKVSHGAQHMNLGLVIALAVTATSVSLTATTVTADDTVIGTQTVPLPDLSPRQANQLRIFEPILLNPSIDIDQATRTAAATELLAMDVPQSTQVLGEAIQSGESSVILAVTEAIGQRSVSPPAALLQPTVTALRNAPDPTQDALSRLLLRFDPQKALAAVAQEANNTTASPEARLGAIKALAAFRSRQGALELMKIIQSSDSEPKIITDATCNSLADLTGLPPSDDPTAWQRWWRLNKDKPAESWLRDMVRTLTRQLSDLDQQLQQERQVNNSLAKRMMDSYRKLWPGLPLQERQLRLESLMSDPLSAVRLFAIERMAILLRDGDDTMDLQQATISLLSDPDISVRAHAADLTDELEFPELQENVAVALSAETDPSVVRQYLLFFAAKPSPKGLAPALPWLANEQLREPAAQSIWSILTKTPPDEFDADSLRDVLSHTTRETSLPSLERLQALVAENEALEEYEGRLDIAPTEERYAIAQGLLARGRHQPLIDRMQDNAIYPLAVESLKTNQPDLAAILTLSSIEPPEAHRELFDSSMRTLVAGMPIDSLLDVDVVLQRSEHTDDSLRADLLIDSLNANMEAISAAEKEAILLRVLPLLLANGDTARASSLLINTDDVLFSPALSKIAFQTALITGNFDRARALTGNLEDWINAFELLVQTSPEAAERLQTYLLEQFKDELNDQQLYRFSKAAEQLTRDPSLAPLDGTNESVSDGSGPTRAPDTPSSVPPGVGPDSSIVEGLPTSGGTQ